MRPLVCTLSPGKQSRRPILISEKSCLRILSALEDPPCTRVLPRESSKKSPSLLLKTARSTSLLQRIDTTPYGLVDPPLPLSAPSDLNGLPPKSIKRTVPKSS